MAIQASDLMKPAEGDLTWLEQMSAQIDHPLLMSLEKSAQMAAQLASSNPLLMPVGTTTQMAAQYTSSMAPVALGEYAAEFMRPPAPALPVAALTAGLAEYLSGYRASVAALETVHQALNPMAINMMNDAVEAMHRANKQAELAAGWAQPFGVFDVGRAALSLSSDLQMARGTLSIGALDDLNVSLGRLYERRQAPPERRPEPPAEPVQVVHLAPGEVLNALSLMLKKGDVAPGDVTDILYSHSTGQRQAGPYPPEWPVIEAAVAIYKKDRRKHTYETFVLHLARKDIEISVATFKRWLEIYEHHTGEQVRPGRGRRGGRAIMS